MGVNPSGEPQRDKYFDAAITLATLWGKRALLLLLAVSFVSLGYYLFVGYLPEFHSDSAVKNLLAAEVLRERSYFPHDWNYVNGDLWVLFGQIFIIPLLPFMANGYKLHAISGLISSGLVLLSLWLITRMAIQSVWMRLVVLTIFVGGVSTNMAENLYGQISYGNVLSLSTFTLYLSWRFLDAGGRRAALSWGLAFIGLVTLIFWGNPQRASAYIAAPMLAALVTWALASGDLLIWRPGARRWVLGRVVWKAVQLLCLLVLAATIGSLLHSAALAHVNNIEGAGSARWLGFDGLVQNLWNTLHGMLGMFGAVLPPDQRVLSPSGIYYGTRFIGICALLVLMPFTVARLMKQTAPSARMFGAFVGSGLFLFVFLQITTTTPDMTDPVSSSRYMLPFLALGVVSIAAYAEENSVRNIQGLIAWGVLLVLLSSLISPLNSFSRMYRPYGKAVQQQLAEDLKGAGLKYGYATYWNAGAVTVLADSEVAVRQVLFVDGIPMPHRHLSSNRWFRQDAWSGQTFLALRSNELKALDQEALFSYTGQPLKILTRGDFTIFVFSENIAKKIPGWDKRRTSDPELRMPASAASRHTIGHLTGVGSLQRLEAEPGEKGFLHYGPYVDLPAGNYQVTFYLSAQAKGEAGYADVISEGGKHVFARQPLDSTADEQKVTLLIAAPDSAKALETRVYSNGEGAMTLRRVEILPVAN